MSFRVTNTFVNETTLSAADLDQNFTDVEAKFNQGITSADLSPVAGITPQQLSNSHFSFLGRVSLITTGPTGFPPYGFAGAPHGVVGFPGPDAQLGDLEIFATTVALRNSGQIGDFIRFRGEVGRFDNGTGNWVVITPWFAALTLTSTAAGGFIAQDVTQSSSPVVVDMSQEPVFAAVIVEQMSNVAAPAGMMTNNGDFLTVTLRAQRVGGLHQ